MSKLWDSLSWFVLVELGEKELAQLLQAGMVQLRCRGCGSNNIGVKQVKQPRRFDDVERWLEFIDAPLVVKGCSNHQLEFHATREFREQALSARSLGQPGKVSPKRLEAWYETGPTDLPTSTNFQPVAYAPAFADSIYEFQIGSVVRMQMIQSRKITS